MALPIKKILFQAFVIPGTVFCASTLPLAILGSEQVVIEFKDEPIFAGQLRQLAAPYLALATAVSVGAGCASVAMSGWRQSHQKSTRTEEELSALQQALNEKEIQLENLKLSDSRLVASGLSSFLEDETQESPTATEQAIEVTAETKTVQNSEYHQPTAKLSQSASSSVSSQIEELYNQLEKITANFASLQQDVQSAPIAVAENSRNLVGHRV